MFHLVTNPNSLTFTNRAQTMNIAISTNGTLQVAEDLDWITTQITNTNFRANSNTDGKRNTDVINSFDSGSSAARSAINYRATSFSGIADWYLPSRDEMVSLANSPHFGSFPVNAPFYWTSTEQSASNAIRVSSSGTASDIVKSTLNSVRPIRKLSFTETTSPYTLGQDLGYGIVFSIDLTNKFVLVGSKVDLPDVGWGAINQIANANFATQLAVTTRVNNRYVINRGVITLTLQQDSDISVQVRVVQESAEQDSSSVFLKDIISNVMVRFKMNERSFGYGIDRYTAILEGKRLMQEFNYNGAKELRSFEAEITPANKVIPPPDFVDYVRLSVVGRNGILIPMYRDDEINTSFQYVKDNDGNIITDEQGYEIKTQGTRRDPELTESFDRRRVFLDDFHNQRLNLARSLPGLTGGQLSYVGQYRWDPDAREFIVDRMPSNFTTVVIEYISDPIFDEKNTERLRIHKFMQEAMELGIYYNFIKYLTDVSQGEKERAKREYYNAFRIAKRRLRTKPFEFVQRMSSDIGFNKAL